MTLLNFEDACAGWDLEEPEQSVLGGFWLEGDSLAPPCQTEMSIVQSILEFSDITQIDTVFDLGCGDGRICILASKMYGCHSVGVEIEADLIRKFRRNVAIHMNQKHEEDLVNVWEGDLRELDLHSATLIILYLLPESIEAITPMLTIALQNGCRLVCNTWGPKTFVPIQQCSAGQYHNVTLLKYDISSLPKGNIGLSTP